ncbi:putative acyl-CoA dehydrogenase [Vibrio aerogenes CECT 7868]|uniref:Putative acyl-CoA dehydrogenase n=1 Tax=Vibrio aerogenes CECT 7868 TaxID=1216006 RepID=A0A1M6AQE8_9VIBR|nr:hypothetical protein [Vibrio aerogenes]SHI38720.1 putative acyl-CoA dehydrogenase [Vibrio aerogenes CECT 7868]
MNRAENMLIELVRQNSDTSSLALIDTVLGCTRLAHIDAMRDYPVQAVEDLNRKASASLLLVPERLGGSAAELKTAAVLLPCLAYRSVNVAALYMFHYQCTARMNTCANEALYRQQLDALVTDAGLMSSAWSEGEANPAMVHRVNNSACLYLSGDKYISTGVAESCLTHVIVRDPEYGGQSFVIVPQPAQQQQIRLKPLSLISFRAAQNSAIHFDNLAIDHQMFLGERGCADILQKQNHENGLNPGLLALGLLARFIDLLKSQFDYICKQSAYTRITAKYRQLVTSLSQALQSGNYFSLAFGLTFKYRATALLRDSILALSPFFGPSVLMENHPVNVVMQHGLLLQYMGPANYQIESRLDEQLFSDCSFDVTFL